MAAEVYTSLANVKAWLSITSSADDALLTRLIEGASQLMTGFLNRDALLMRTITETRDGNGARRLMLKAWPVLRIVSVTIDGAAVPSDKVQFARWDGAGVGVLAETFLTDRAFTLGRANVVVTYVAGYGVDGEAWIIPSTPYQVTAAAPNGRFIADAGATFADGAALSKVAANPSAGQYSVDTAGTYTFAAADAGKAMLISYSTLPADLENACFEMVGEQYRYRSRIGEVSKSVGGEVVSFNQKAMTEYVSTLLAPYKSVVPIC